MIHMGQTLLIGVVRTFLIMHRVNYDLIHISGGYFVHYTSDYNQFESDPEQLTDHHTI